MFKTSNWSFSELSRSWAYRFCLRARIFSKFRPIVSKMENLTWIFSIMVFQILKSLNWSFSELSRSWVYRFCLRARIFSKFRPIGLKIENLRWIFSVFSLKLVSRQQKWFVFTVSLDLGVQSAIFSQHVFLWNYHICNSSTFQKERSELWKS